MKKTDRLKIKNINITPHRSILIKISQTGYSIQEALSELIDNAIDARLTDKKLIVKIRKVSGRIEVMDNGVGMNEDEAIKSIRLGFSSKKDKLGEFGLGLKTSTSFLGKSFELYTTQLGSNKEYIIKYDEDDWLKSGNWNKFPFFINSDANKNTSGTKIIIKELKVNFSNELMRNIIAEFGIRFGPFIKNNEVDIIFNKTHCKAYEPVFLDKKKNKINIKFGKVKIAGWWGYQLAGINKNYYGFNTFRRGRLVTTYDKIGLTPNQNVKQIIGDLAIEGIPITHDKKEWLRSSDEFRKFERKMRVHFKSFEKKPKRILSGFPVSGGGASGVVRILSDKYGTDLNKEINKVKKGDILVAKMTRPQFILAIRRASGIITDMGGNLCHAAIVAREFNIPAVAGTQIATSSLRDGQKIILDGNEGYIYEN